MAHGESNGHVTITSRAKLERSISKTAGDAIEQQSLITRQCVVQQYGRL